METREGGLLKKILPPKLEDAGLENCALPPESIKEAFLKAANSVRTRAASILPSDSDEDDCIEDLGPSKADTLVGISPVVDNPGPCVTKKGGFLEPCGGDDVVCVGSGEGEICDRVLGLGVPPKSDGERACVDVLQGLEIREKKKKKKKDEDEEDERQPRLAEAYI
eukprot:TRINITY_DN4589_c0_g1_i1.p1 TRINITY_DN4589_c0_g1~~TRINITY_DN4589_c0_g1_i1.p1  ORF type:complete len:166 (-),score=43.78 TRINITY_DN4589_c0_g1_i1:35-532(-)